MISGRSGYATAYDRDDVLVWFRWNVKYDDVANTVTVTAESNRNDLSKANLIAILANGSERVFDLLTLGNAGGSIINQGPTVFPGVNIKVWTGKGGAGVMNIRDDWAI